MTSELPPAARALVGIPGLDDILGGGLTRDRLYLVEGTPGTGKTTLSLQFLLEGARRGESGLYITLSESAEELRAVAATHGWSLDSLAIFELVGDTGLDPDSEQSVLHPSEVELGETTREVMRQVEDMRPSRVVFDSLSELRLLAQSPLRYRRQILALKQFLSSRRCTVLMLDDRTADPTDLQLHSIAHGVISLEQSPRDFGAERRRLRVVKMRGVKFRGGFHDFLLETGGLAVFPRLVAAEHHTDFDPVPVTTGNDGLDRLLGGGLVPGTNVLLSGPSGVGKTTTAVSCMLAALERGERATYYLFDEGLGTFLARARALGMNLDRYLAGGGLTVQQVDPAELSPGEFSHRVRAAVTENRSTFLAIDSLNAYLKAMPGENYLQLQMHEMLSYLNQQGVKTILVLGQHGVLGDVRVDVDLSYLSDTIVLFRFFEAQGEVRTAVSVVKSRTSAHERTIRELKLSARGLLVGAALSDFEGVLSGLPSYHGAVSMLRRLIRSSRRGLAPVPERMLVLAPRGRDAKVIEQVLARESLACQICADLACMRRCLEDDVGGIVVTEEALFGPNLEAVLTWCENQQPWSDMPFVVMATRQAGHRTGIAARLLERLGNVMLLERPVNAETLASAARAALRARRRQYLARTLLDERERNERALLDLNETLERRVEQRARELDVAHQTLSVALDSAGMGSWEFDLITGETRRSLQHDRIFGYPEGRAAWGREIFLDHVVEEDLATVTAQFDHAATAGGGLDLECGIRRADGVLRWIAVKGRVGYNAVGRSMRLAGVVMDVTDRRKTEDKLHRAQKMEAIGQLTGGVAHDFNNLLTVIIGGLDMVLRKPEDTPRVIRLAGAALLAARRGEELTAQLLAFSRRQMLRPVTIDPAPLLADFADLVRRALGEAVTLHLDLEPGTHPIRVDPAQFESAVLNLAVNARDAMPNGGSVTLACRDLEGSTAHGPDLPPGPAVMVSVTDAGTGIDAQTLSRAFEPFFTTKDVGKGSGLGLSQVYGFARSAGGTVEIESVVGSGTSVKLYFPRSANLPSQEPRFTAVNAPLRPAEGGETVLLVEDDEQVRAMAVESLEELHYTVLVARDARQALDHVNGSDRIDVMFSDVVMPGGMDGAQLAIEARKRRPALKILLTSGYVGEPASAKMIAAGVDVLTKPYRRDELARRLRMVMSKA